MPLDTLHASSRSPANPCPHPPFTLLDGCIFAALLLGMLYGIGSYGLYEPHEGHFAGVGREMFLSGDWITPRLNGSPYLNKPPLFYWMIASSYALLGITAGAARVPQVLIALAGIALAWKWARELFGARAGQVAAIMLGVSAGWYLFSHQLLIDELLCVVHLLGVYALWKCVCAPQSWWAWAGFFATLGLSIMSKGLVGPLMLTIVWVLFAAVRRDWSSFKACRFWSHFPLIVLIVAPWVTLVELRNPGFLYYVLVNEHFLRMIDERWPKDYQVSKTSAGMFVLIALIWTAPWSLLLPQVARFSWRGLRQPAEVPVEAKSRADAILLLVLAALVPTVIFLPIPSRLIYYCLPTLPPFAVLAAGWWVSTEDAVARPGASWTRGFTGRRSAAIVMLVVGAAIIAAGFFLGATFKNVPELKAAPQTLEYMPGFAGFIGAALLSGGLLLLWGKPGAAIAALGVCLLAGEAANTKGFAAFDPMRSSKRLVDELLPRTGPDWIWISEGSAEVGSAGGLAFYLGLDGRGKPRTVLIMKEQIEPDDKGVIHVNSRRSPPRFPGPLAAYLIGGAQLREIWSGPKPALFITDFLRTDAAKDPFNLPPEPRHVIEVKEPGQRRVFANDAAWKQLRLSGSRPVEVGQEPKEK